MIKIKNVDQETIKDINKKTIINILYNKRELTKQQIAKEMGVSIPTVINNINELIEEGIAEEAGVGESSGGRKPVIVKFKPNSRYSFGVEINLHLIRILFTNLDSEIIEEVVLEHSEDIKSKDEKHIEQLLERVCNEINEIILKNNINRNKILGVGISLPGTVNEEQLVLELAPNLSVRNFNFNWIAEKLCIPVYIENEANAAALAELRLGVAKDMRNLVYLSITEGIGTGIVVQDYIYKGKNKRAGEFGHMTIIKDGKQCMCGRKGCWEQYASEKALLDQYAKVSLKSCSDIKSFFRDIEDENSNAIKVWQEYLDYLAEGIQNIILILDPHYIVIGGRISNYEHLLIKPLRERVFTENSFYGEGDTKIFASKLKSNSSAMGAALLPFQKLFFLNDKVL